MVITPGTLAINVVHIQNWRESGVWVLFDSVGVDFIIVVMYLPFHRFEARLANLIPGLILMHKF